MERIPHESESVTEGRNIDHLEEEIRSLQERIRRYEPNLFRMRASVQGAWEIIMPQADRPLGTEDEKKDIRARLKWLLEMIENDIKRRKAS